MTNTIIKETDYGKLSSDGEMPDDSYSSVEFSYNCVTPAYIFRIRDIMASDLGIMVKEDSGLLKQIQTGDILDLKYLGTGKSRIPRSIKTEIKHIVKNHWKYKGHYSVGLHLLESLN